MDKEKWYFKNYVLVIMFLTVGPLMLPLVWGNPNFSKQKKIIVTVIVILLTCILGLFFIRSINMLNEYLKLLTKL